MRKFTRKVLFALGLTAMSIAPLVQAQNIPAMGTQSPSGFYNFTAKSAVGPTEYIDISNNPFRTYSIEVGFTATPSVCTYQVEASDSRLAWYITSGGSALDCTTGALTFYVDKPVKYLRVRILTLTTTGTVSFYYAGIR